MNVFISYDFEHDTPNYEILKLKFEQIEGVSVTIAKARAAEALNDELLSAIQTSDMCVFVCTEHSIQSKWCVAELGAFWGQGKKILIWKIDVDKEQIDNEFPQFAGLTIADTEDEVVTRVAELKKTLTDNQKRSGDPSLMVPVRSFIDVQIANEYTPDNWKSRDLYIGVQGARNWLNVAKDDRYVPFVAARESLFKEGDPIGTVIGKAQCSSMISFGPGDAQLDRKIVLRYCNHNDQPFTYYPVDINPYLLSGACHEIKSNTKADVPFGILADFEENLDKIFDLIKRRESKSCLFSCLGYTLGNLDSDELVWIETVASMMSSGDYLLFDYLSVDDNFNAKVYEDTAHEDYTASLKNWIAHPTSVSTGLGRNRLVENFEKAFRFAVDGSGGEKIDAIVGTRILYTGYGLDEPKKSEYVDKLVVKMHRYRSEQFVEKICNQTKLERVDHVDSTSNDNEEDFYKSSLSLFVKS